MDNLSVHKSGRVQALIKGAGCELWYLPAYSPDLSPIELAFAQLKAWLRRAQARTHDALEAAIARALDQIMAANTQNYFKHIVAMLVPPSWLSNYEHRSRSGQ
jgi:transposase